MIKDQADQPFGVILAGGRGRRMGARDKAEVALAGRPLIAHVMDRFAPQVAQVAVNSNRALELEVPVIADSIAGHPGPLAGILAAMDWAAGAGAAQVVTVAVDTPFLPRDLVARLGAEGPAVARTGDGWQPTVGLWPVALREELRLAIGAGQRKVMDWAHSVGARAVAFDAAEPFFNVNTPEDLARAEAMIGEQE